MPEHHLDRSFWLKREYQSTLEEQKLLNLLAIDSRRIEYKKVLLEKNLTESSLDENSSQDLEVLSAEIEDFYASNPFFLSSLLARGRFLKKHRERLQVHPFKPKIKLTETLPLPLKISHESIMMADNLWTVGKVFKFHPFFISLYGFAFSFFNFSYGVFNAIYSLREITFTVIHKQPHKHKTNLITQTIISLLSISMVGLSIALGCTLLGIATIASAPFFPLVIITLLMAIPLIKLIGTSIKLKTSKHKYDKAKQFLSDFQNEHPECNELAKIEKKLQLLHKEKLLLTPKLAQLLQKKKAKKKLSWQEFNVYHRYLALCDEQERLDHIKFEFDYQLAQYNHIKFKHRTNERLVAHQAITSAISLMIIAVVVLTSTVLFSAATIASFAIAPIVLFSASIALGLGLKTFNYIDEKKNFSISRSIRNFFKKKPNIRKDNKKKKESSHHLILKKFPVISQPQPILSKNEEIFSQEEAPTQSEISPIKACHPKEMRKNKFGF